MWWGLYRNIIGNIQELRDLVDFIISQPLHLHKSNPYSLVESFHPTTKKAEFRCSFGGGGVYIICLDPFFFFNQIHYQLFPLYFITFIKTWHLMLKAWRQNPQLQFSTTFWNQMSVFRLPYLQDYSVCKTSEKGFTGWISAACCTYNHCPPEATESTKLLSCRAEEKYFGLEAWMYNF